MRTKKSEPDVFDSRLRQLAEFVAEFGDLPRYDGKRRLEEPMYRFLCSQRRQQRDGVLSRRRRTLLNREAPGWDVRMSSLRQPIGTDDPSIEPFAGHLRDLAAFVKEHGRRPRRGPERSVEERRLGAFCQQSFPQARREAIRDVLRDVPIVVPPQNQSPFDPDEMVEKYRAFVESERGVPRARAADSAERSLARWAGQARKDPALRERLKAVAAPRRSAAGARRMRELAAFVREEHDVPSSGPTRSPSERSLAVWMLAQRKSPERAAEVQRIISAALRY